MELYQLFLEFEFSEWQFQFIVYLINGIAITKIIPRKFSVNNFGELVLIHQKYSPKFFGEKNRQIQLKFFGETDYLHPFLVNLTDFSPKTNIRWIWLSVKPRYYQSKQPTTIHSGAFVKAKLAERWPSSTEILGKIPRIFQNFESVKSIEFLSCKGKIDTKNGLTCHNSGKDFKVPLFRFFLEISAPTCPVFAHVWSQ